MLIFMSRSAILKIHNSIYVIYIAKHRVLTYFIHYCGQFEIQILDIFVNLKTVSTIVFNTIDICYKFQSLIILDIYLLSEYFESWSISFFTKSSSS